MINQRSMHYAGFYPKDGISDLPFLGSQRKSGQLGAHSNAGNAPQIIMTSYSQAYASTGQGFVGGAVQVVTPVSTPPGASLSLQQPINPASSSKNVVPNATAPNDALKVVSTEYPSRHPVTTSTPEGNTENIRVRSHTEVVTHRQALAKLGFHTPQNKKILTPELPTSSTLANESDTQALISTKKSTPAVVAQAPQANKDEDYSVTEEFIEECNKHLGNITIMREAKDKIEKMRVLGGVDVPPTTGGPIPVVRKNLYLARLNLARLAGIGDAAIQNLALDCLLEILEKDDFSQVNAIGLLEVAVIISKLLQGQVVQFKIIPMQVKVAQVYSFVLGLIQFHHSKGHINGITRELKAELIHAALSLEGINRRKNASLHFFVRTAHEGALRIPDDKLELVEIVQRLWQGCLAIFTLFPARVDTVALSTHVGGAISGMDITGEEDWYDSMLILREVAEIALKDIRNLKAMQLMIHRKASQLGWKFCFAAVGFLGKIVFYGVTEEIRRQALEGLPELIPNRKNEYVKVGGIRQFATYDRLSFYFAWKDIYHLKPPHLTNPNVRVRRLCVDYLIWMATAARDPGIRTRAANILVEDVQKETNKKIKSTLEKFTKDHPTLIRSSATTDLSVSHRPAEESVHRSGSGYWSIVAFPGERIRFSPKDSSVPGAPFRFDVTDGRFQDAFIDLGVDTENMTVSESTELLRPRSASASYAEKGRYFIQPIKK